jgi:MoaA/NifB/PqqE/SkfB family radical SAM enzyme
MTTSDSIRPEDNHRGPGFWETLRELLGGSRRPLDCVQVEVSTCCPGRCAYCPRSVLAGRWQDRDMPMETYRRLWPLMRNSRRVHLQGWGEPLRHPRFLEMAALARQAGCAVSTTTCGSGVPALAEPLVESGLDIIAFSLAGTDSSSNAIRRGVGFDQVCAAIEHLQSVRRARQGVHLEIHIAYLLLASELTAVEALPALMARLGVHAAVISTLDFLPAPELAAEAYAAHETGKLARAREVLERTAAEARRMGRDFFWALPDPASAAKGCRENVGRSLFVAADGSVSPCVFTHLPLAGDDPTRRVFGNANDQDALAIWENPAYIRFRQALCDGQPDPRCRACAKRFEM